MTTGAPPQVTVVGGGLAGGLAALALAERGATVQLLAPAGGLAATALSYGSVQGISAARRWRRLQARHGQLGWRRSAVVLHGLGGLQPSCEVSDRANPADLPVAVTERGVRWPLPARPWLPAPLPFSRVDTSVLTGALPQVLTAAGIRCIDQRVRRLEALAAGRWQLQLEDGSSLESNQLLLAAGAGCRALWPSLPPRLRTSWAGVLVQSRIKGSCPWLGALRRGWMVFPAQLQRPSLERASATCSDSRWCVDVSMAPWGRGALLGQICWLGAAEPPTAAPLAGGPDCRVAASRAQAGETDRSINPDGGTPGRDPGGEAGCAGAPDPDLQERRLRQALGQLHPALADLEADFRQVPVSYSSDGTPVAEQVAPGLWVLAGSGNAFSHLLPLAERLAAELLAAAGRADSTGPQAP